MEARKLVHVPSMRYHRSDIISKIGLNRGNVACLSQRSAIGMMVISGVIMRFVPMKTNGVPATCSRSCSFRKTDTSASASEQHQLIMSLHLLEEECSLEAALAFLDSCGDDQQQDLSAPFDVAFNLDALLNADDMVLDSPTSDHESIDGITRSNNASSDGGDRQLVARVKPTRQRATKKHKPAGPAAPRRRTRTEILELREQVIQLTTRIDKLNKRSRVQPPIGPEFHSNRITHGTRLPLIDAQGSSFELGSVVLEREKLREAELLNAKLKVAWRRQLKLCQQLENVFKMKLTPAVRHLITNSGLCAIFISVTPICLYLFLLSDICTGHGCSAGNKKPTADLR